MDKITSNRIQLLHPKIRDEVEMIVGDCNNCLSNGPAQVRIVQGYRTIQEQNILFAQGRTAPGKIVTNAPGGASYHNFGLALDFSLLINNTEISWDTNRDFNKDNIPDWAQVVQIFKTYDWAWGGDFKSIKDMPHFEKSFGLTTGALKQRYDQRDFITGGYVRI